MKENLPLHEAWFKTTDWILERCDRLPKHTRFTLAGRIANHALDIQELLIETAFSKQKIILLHRVNLILEKLRLLFRICFERKYINVHQYEFIQTQINTAGKMVGGWLKSCKE